MKRGYAFLLCLPFVIMACSSRKTYFTAKIRGRIESNNQSLEKIQFYADRDIVLRRDLETGETKVSSGKVRFENGHYVNIITLPKNTPGVCTFAKPNVVGISFESGDNHFLTFGKTLTAQPNDPYRILANYWPKNKDYGVITYEGKEYHIQPEGTEATILIKSKVLRKSRIEEREMKGRKVSDRDVPATVTGK